MSIKRNKPAESENPHNVAPGQVWRDNNPRETHAVFTVDRFIRKGGKWCAQGIRGGEGTTGRISTVQLARMDGKHYTYLPNVGGGDYAAPGRVP